MIWYKYVNYKVLPEELTKKMIDAWDSSPNNNEDDNVNMREAFYAMFKATETETVGEICVDMLENIIEAYKVYHNTTHNNYITMLENIINYLKTESKV